MAKKWEYRKIFEPSSLAVGGSKTRLIGQPVRSFLGSSKQETRAEEIDNLYYELARLGGMDGS
jgi:hypothetical protein